MRKPRRLVVVKPPTDRTSAVIYARVSSREQEREGYSIPAQLKLLRSYAEARGMHVVEEFVDVESAKGITKRDGFLTMIRLLADEKKRGSGPRLKTILVEKTDRLYRNLRDSVTIDELDVEIHLVKESAVISKESQSHEKFMHGIKLLVAKQYIDNLSEEVIKGQIDALEEGHLPTRAPLGYRNVRIDGRSTVQVDPLMGPLITRLFELYAAGRCSLDDVRFRMAAEGLRNAGGHPISKARAHWILTNPFYHGELIWKGRRFGIGKHVPLVSFELFERVKDRLEGKGGTGGGKAHKHQWAYTGLVSCGHCGSAYVAEIKKGKYVYYHCSGARGKCPEKYVPEAKLDAALRQALAAIRIDDKVCAWITTALRESHAEMSAARERARLNLEVEYKRTMGRVDALFNLKLDGEVSPDLYRSKQAEFRVHLARIREDIASHEGANDCRLEDGAELIELAQRAVTLYEKQEPLERRRLLEFVLSNSTWKGGELFPIYRKPFNDLVVAKDEAARTNAAFAGENGVCKVWSAWLDDYRTKLACPDAGLRAALDAARALTAA